MHILDYYQDEIKREELKQILTIGAQSHPDGLPDFFLEKDLWVTEILRLLYDENLLGEYAVAFKGGTALSKCWKVIDRFSEDIDLSIHWADLAEVDDEAAAWQQSVKSGSQRKKFRDQQTGRLTEWSEQLVLRLNERFGTYGLDELGASLEEGSHGEKINIHFPRVATTENGYHLDYILLEFGGRNRGQPTIACDVSCYLAEVPELQGLMFPAAKVQAYDPAYIMWEKLTALHQYATMEREPKTHRLARHWYDVDCMLSKSVFDPLSSVRARNDVVEMKAQRWAERGVDYKLVLTGQMELVPDANRLEGIANDHQDAVQARMFFIERGPNSFEQIIDRIYDAQNTINNATTLMNRIEKEAYWACSGAWKQGVFTLDGKEIRSEMTLISDPEKAVINLVKKIIDRHAP